VKGTSVIAIAQSLPQLKRGGRKKVVGEVAKALGNSNEKLS